jgi:streptomycin 6-kinase
VSIPAVVRNKALAVGAARWLEELPGLITSLERDWRITVGRPFPDATEAPAHQDRAAARQLRDAGHR